MAKKRKVQPWCACIMQVQEKLEKEHGAQLVRYPRINFDTAQMTLTPPTLAVERIGKGRKKLPTIICGYCPFCGTKYPDD